MDYTVTCKKMKSDAAARDHACERIQFLGGELPHAFHFPTDEVIRKIDHGDRFVAVSTFGGTQTSASIRVVQGVSGRYLRSSPDHSTDDNLLHLPDCFLALIL